MLDTLYVLLILSVYILLNVVVRLASEQLGVIFRKFRISFLMIVGLQKHRVLPYLAVECVGRK